MAGSAAPTLARYLHVRASLQKGSAPQQPVALRRWASAADLFHPRHRVGLEAQVRRLALAASRGAGVVQAADLERLVARLTAGAEVSLRPAARRESIVEFADRVRALPQVIQVFFLGGDDDFLLHIAVADSSEMREFVLEHLSAQSSVASTRTSIVFDYHRNSVAASFH